MSQGDAAMGLSSSRTKQTNNPSAFSKPYISAGADALQGAYSAAQPAINAVSGTLNAQLPGYANRAFGDNPMLSAATSYNTDVLGGKYMGAQSPGLGSVLDRTARDVRDRVAAQFSSAGRTGSGANTFALSRGLGDALGAIEYQDYGAERQRQSQAAALAPSLDAARDNGLGAYLQLANAATGMPMDAAQSYAGGLGSLLGQYNTQTSKSSQSLGSVLGQVAGSGLAGWASGGFKGF